MALAEAIARAPRMQLAKSLAGKQGRMGIFMVERNVGTEGGVPKWAAAVGI
jgi:hypothetical protein